jgi:hypothetical protein
MTTSTPEPEETTTPPAEQVADALEAHADELDSTPVPVGEEAQRQSWLAREFRALAARLRRK